MPRRFLRLSRRIAGEGEEEEGSSDLIAHLTWFPVNEKLVADGHERTVSRLSLERKRWFNSAGRISFRPRLYLTSVYTRGKSTVTQAAETTVVALRLSLKRFLDREIIPRKLDSRLRALIPRIPSRVINRPDENRLFDIALKNSISATFRVFVLLFNHHLVSRFLNFFQNIFQDRTLSRVYERRISIRIRTFDTGISNKRNLIILL